MAWVQVLFLFSIVSNSFNSTWHKPVVGQAVLSCWLRFAVKCLYELCLQAFYARRNRRNSPSMARFLLASASMPRHFCALQHNSTDTKQLRYSPTRQHRLPPPPASATYAEIIIVPFLTCGSFGTALATFMWEAHILRRFPLDTLNLPEGMQCVLKKIMNCREVPYSLITKSPGISTIYSHMGSWLTS